MSIVEEIEIQVTLMIDKFILDNIYTEVSYDQMKRSIREYLIEEYNKEIIALSDKIEREKKSEILKDVEDYRKEYAGIKINLLNRIAAISCTGEKIMYLK